MLPPPMGFLGDWIRGPLSITFCKTVLFEKLQASVQVLLAFMLIIPFSLMDLVNKAERFGFY